MTRKDYVLALLVAMVWGANFTVIQLGLNGVPPMLLAALRFLLVAFPAVFFVPRPKVNARYWISYGATVGVGQFGSLFYAMHIGMPAGVASVVLQSQAFFTLILAAVWLKERIARSQLVGLAIATLGLGLVGRSSGLDQIHAIPPAAFLLSLAGAASWAAANIVIKQMSATAEQGTNTLSIIVWSSLVPPIPLLLLALLLDTPTTLFQALTSLDELSIFSVFFIAFGATLFGFGTWSELLSKYSSSVVAPLSLLVPITGLLTARIVLNEHMALSQWIGCCVIILGLVLTTVGIDRLRAWFSPI
jgi:O-acetylserine/cysteine efflux transporter